MSIEYTTPILNKIKEYDKIIIFRHERPDGDCTGATKGLKRILNLSFPGKDIRVINPGKSDYLAFLGEDDGEVDESQYRESLGIALDTATTKRIANKGYDRVRELIKIDHHIPVDDYGTLRWVEEERSSCCEMIVKFYDNHKDELKIDLEAAKYLYTGMVTDSGRFRFRSVSGETLRLAGLLLDVGVDTDTLYANLYMRDFDSFRFESYNGGSSFSQNPFHLSFTFNETVKYKLNKSRIRKTTTIYITSCQCSLGKIASTDNIVRLQLPTTNFSKPTTYTFREGRTTS